MRALIFAIALGACASGPGTDAPPAGVNTDAVVAAERAFAARAGEAGWIPAFRAFTAPDGQIVQADLVSAPQSLAETPDDGVRTLYWEPAYAGIARSGDFGFTTGPVSFDEARTPRGQYFTVWRRQPDGSWKWIYDGGPGPVAEAGPLRAADYAVPSLPIAAQGVGAEAAAAQVRALETGLSRAADLSGHLASDAHVYRARRPRAYSAADAAANIVFPSDSVTYSLRRVESSSAGDLVFTLGEARWTQDGATRNGFFGRIWQLRPAGWRVVYDQVVGGAPPPPAN